MTLQCQMQGVLNGHRYRKIHPFPLPSSGMYGARKTFGCLLYGERVAQYISFSTGIHAHTAAVFLGLANTCIDHYRVGINNLNIGDCDSASAADKNADILRKIAA